MSLRMIRSSMICSLIGFAALSATALGADGASFEKDIRPVVMTYCSECHNPQKKKGDLDITPFETADAALKEEVIWEGIADKVRAGEMPPKRATKKPDDAQKQLIISWVAKHIKSGEQDCG